MSTELQIDSVRLANFVRSEDGPIFRQLIVTGEKVKQLAINNLSDKAPGWTPRKFLQDGIVKRISQDQDGPVVSIVALKTKTEPHHIFGNPLLVFEAPKNSGRVIYVNSSGGAYVDHPGSDFSNYLKTAFENALRAIVGHI